MGLLDTIKMLLLYLGYLMLVAIIVLFIVIVVQSGSLMNEIRTMPEVPAPSG